jgi:hypothetical protein
MTDFAPDAVLSFFEQRQHYAQVKSRLMGKPAQRRVNKPMPIAEVRSEPVEEKIEVEAAPFANDNEGPIAPPTIAFIVAHVARFYGLSRSDLPAHRRDRATVWPRHIAFYLSKELTLNSWSEIARRVGDRDHTTVLNSYSRVREALTIAPESIEGDLREITKRITARVSPFDVHPSASRPFWEASRLCSPHRMSYPRARVIDWDFWTRERIEQLRTLWNVGYSQDAIAAEMGTTKGAVSGKISRLGLIRSHRGVRK